MRSTMACGVFLVTLVMLVGAASASSHDAQTVRTTSSLDFEPETITVPVGTTVVWENAGGGFHTVTSTDSHDTPAPNGRFDMELPGGEKVEFTFDTLGTYRYYCKPHADIPMQGTVVVQAAGADDGGGANGDAPGVAPMLAVSLLALLALALRRRG